MYSEPVQRAYDIYQRYIKNRPPKRKSGHLSVVNARHRQVLQTWSGAGSGRYFTVWYCPECKVGRISDMVYDHIDGPNARELGIIRKKDWPLDCPVVLKEIAEAGEQAKLALEA